MATAPQGSAVYWTAWFLEILSYCAVNCFGLISGFVMVDKSIKIKSIVFLWMQIIFYSILISVIVFILFPESRTTGNLISSFLPIIRKQWWYASSYFGLYFLIPILNAAINNITKQTHQKILLSVLLGIGCIDCIISSNDPFSLNAGYSTAWLILLYLFGAYIKKYEIHKKITAIKSILGFFAMIVFTFASKAVIQALTQKILGQPKAENTFISYISITVLLSAIFLFFFCLNVKTGNFALKITCFLSPVTFGVYLIHVHPLIFNFVFKDAFSFLVYKPLPVMILGVLLAVAVIFVLCTVIELMRIQLFKLMRISKLSEYISQKLNNVYLTLFKK